MMNCSGGIFGIFKITDGNPEGFTQSFRAKTLSLLPVIRKV